NAVDDIAPANHVARGPDRLALADEELTADTVGVGVELRVLVSRGAVELAQCPLQPEDLLAPLPQITGALRHVRSNRAHRLAQTARDALIVCRCIGGCPGFLDAAQLLETGVDGNRALRQRGVPIGDLLPRPCPALLQVFDFAQREDAPRLRAR